MFYIMSVVFWFIFSAVLLVGGHENMVSNGWFQKQYKTEALWITALLLAFIPIVRAYTCCCLFLAINVNRDDYKKRKDNDE